MRHAASFSSTSSSNPFGETRAREPPGEIDITLITALWLSDLRKGKKPPLMLSTWDGPKILVVASRDGGNDINSDHSDFLSFPTVSGLNDLTIISVDVAPCMHYLTTPVTKKTASDVLGRGVERGFDSLPDNMLYNVGLDAAQTDHVVVVPKGMVLMSGATSVASSSGNRNEKEDPLAIYKQAKKGALGPPNLLLAKQIKALSAANQGISPVALVVPAFSQKASKGFHSKPGLPNAFPSVLESTATALRTTARHFVCHFALGQAKRGHRT